MIDSSATDGQPVRPSIEENYALVHLGVASVSLGSWACWATTPSNALTYSSARRMSDASRTQLPWSEKTRTSRRGVRHGAELGEPLAAPARR